MKSVGAYQAKTHLPKLLKVVRGGETVTITRHGNPVAMLVAIHSGPNRLKTPEAIQALRQFRKGRKLGLDLRALIEAGRR